MKPVAVMLYQPVASLGLVSPGAATDGVTVFFPEKKLTTSFSHRRLQSDDFFTAVVSSQLAPGRRLSSVLSKFSHKKIISFGVTPWMVSPGAVRPHLLVTPVVQANCYR